jgi:hypothetical protein
MVAPNPITTTWARPGVLCICAKDDWDEIDFPFWPAPSRVPMLHEILTVKEVIDDHPMKSSIRGGVALTFVELGTDDSYSIAHFAPWAPDPSDPDNLDFWSAYDG